jgi:hypothetical protein
VDHLGPPEPALDAGEGASLSWRMTTGHEPLPAVRHALPWAGRLLFVAGGLTVIALPTMELGRALWPVTAFSLVPAAIILGAAAIGVLLVLAGLLGEAQSWSYPPRTLVVERRLWRRVSQSRLTGRDISSIEVEHVANSEGPDTWRVVVVPLKAVDRDGRRTRHTYRTHGFRSQAEVEAGRRALIRHLGLANEAELIGADEPRHGASGVL